MRLAVVRILTVGGWLTVIVLLGLWLVAAVHRGHLAAMLIVGTGLATLIVLPLLAGRLRFTHRS